MAYNKVNWKDYPDTTTPVNAANLGHMDDEIKTLDTNVGDMSRISDKGSSIADILEQYTDMVDEMKDKDVELLHSGLITDAGNVTLAGRIDDYKFLIFKAWGHDNAWRTDFVPVTLLKLHPHEWMFFEVDHYPRAIITYINSNTLHISYGTSGARFLDGIYGLR